VASSFLSVALSEVFGSALNGRCSARPELVGVPLPLSATLSVVPSRGGDRLLRALFEPLGYTLTLVRHELDDTHPEWGMSSYYTVTLSNVIPLQKLLTHLYVLIPVLDDEKHYWVGKDEIEKLLAKGKGWLDMHPEKELITLRYLKHRHSLARRALEQLQEDEVSSNEDEELEAKEEPLTLHEQRLTLVRDMLKDSGARKVVDLGCGEGKLLRLLLREKQFTTILGMDVSYQSLERAKERLRIDQLREKDRERIKLIQGSLTYRDERLSEFDGAAVIEVIEHLDPSRLAAFERVVFECARPLTVIVTTPNVEYNVRYATLPSGKFRHKDHRFEWTRAQFESWAQGIAVRFGYSVTFRPVGDEDTEVGAPTQMGVFQR